MTDERLKDPVIQELMKNPRGFLVQLANYDITDEEGRNFAFTSREVLDRTAGITFDLGDAIGAPFNTAEWKALVDAVSGEDIATALAAAAAAQADALAD